MSTKTSTAQPPGRRTPLSLNTSTKQTHKQANNKNDNNKKEANSYNHQKTDNLRKDSQAEKKNFVEKKNNATDTRKLSSDSKKADEVKTAQAQAQAQSEENKKGQNGVSANGVKDKEKTNTNQGTKSGGASTPKKDSQKANMDGAKPKSDTSSAPSKKESQKAAAEKKEESVSTEVVKEHSEKVVDDSVQKLGEKEKEKKEDSVKEPEKKKSNETISDAKKTETTKTPEICEKEVMDVKDVKKAESKKESSVAEQKVEEQNVAATVENKIEQSPKVEKKPEPEQTEDVEMMEPLTYEDELPPKVIAASTPAKPLRSDEFIRRNEPKSEAAKLSASVHTPERKNCPKTISSISGRRSIRPIGDYSFSGNLQIRESYRKINTELDFTTSSLNVTVGSEVPNNDSFSIFYRSRKRDRSSPSRQSAMEVQGDISPKSPKRARIDIGMSGFFSAMASPITMLRSRLARTSVQSTPKKQPETPIEDDVVENVSGISVNEEITATEDLTMNPDSTVDNAAIENDQQKYEDPIESSEKPAAEDVKEEDDLKYQDIVVKAIDPQAKKKCSIM